MTRNVAGPAVPIERGVRIFYGWIVVLAAFTVLAVAYGIQFSFGVFMHYISADTGWNRGTLSLPYSMYVFVYSALSFASGRLTDRYGPRRVITIGGCLLGGGVMLIGNAHALWQLYMALGVIAARGMSATYVPCNATVVRWFTIRRGLSLSITSSGASFGMFVFPPIATALIEVCGWRYAYAILGLSGLIAIMLCAHFTVRDPEQMGLSPDGEQAPAHLAFDRLADHTSAADWTVASAGQTGAFRLLTAIFTLTWLVVFMPMVHIVPFAIDLGIPQVRAALTISVIGLAGFAGRLLAGTISDWLGRLPALGLSLVLQALSFAGFTVSHEIVVLYSAAAVFGISYGGITALFPALVGDFFGRLAIGEIVGVIFSIAASASAFGPLIARYFYTAMHTYRVAFELGAALNLVAAMLLFLLKRPVRSIVAPPEATYATGIPQEISLPI